jgi:type VI secretion system protein ImpB
MPVDLHFNGIEDFEPARVLDQVPSLKALLETRNRLRDLMSKADRSEELERLLETVLKNPADLNRISAELGLGKEG